MINERQLVALLYRADWTQISMSAEVRWQSDEELYHEMIRSRQPRSAWQPGPPWARRGEAPDDGPSAPQTGGASPDDREPSARPLSGRILIAPGTRYREETTHRDGSVTLHGSDGVRCWRHGSQHRPHRGRDQEDGPGEHGEHHGPGESHEHHEHHEPGQDDGNCGHGEERFFEDMEQPVPELLCPSRLLEQFELGPAEPIRFAGREAYRLVARPRQHGMLGMVRGVDAGPDRAEIVADAALGILLRYEEFFRGRPLRLTELREITVDPPEAADPALFAPPPGTIIGESTGAMFTGPGWQAAKCAASFGASALGLAIRYGRCGRAPRQDEADPEAEMPHDQADAAVAAGPAAGGPVGDDLLHLLYRAGLSARNFGAELHRWTDAATMVQQLRSAGHRAGIGGLDRLADAIAVRERQQSTRWHQVTRIRIAEPDRYRIDYLRGEERSVRTVAWDGQRQWKAYRDRVGAGPPGPPPREIPDLIDPCWLLSCQLSGQAEVTVGGRPGFRLRAARSPHDHSAFLLSHRPSVGWWSFPVVVVVDAELGILLRLTSFTGGRPAVRFEFRDVAVATEPLADDEFRIQVPPGTPTVELTGGPLDDAPEPMRRAAHAAGEITRRAGPGMAAAARFLKSLR